MNISEQAISAAIEAYNKTRVIRVEDVDLIKDLLIAAAPYMSDVQAKRLTWRIFCSKSLNREAETPFGTYVIQNESNVWRLYLPNEDKFCSEHESDSLAEAAAQADYEKRFWAMADVIAAEPSPAREQALEEAEELGSLKQWDIQDHLKTSGDIAEYLQAILDDGNSKLLINAVSDVIRALKSHPAPQTGGGE